MEGGGATDHDSTQSSGWSRRKIVAIVASGIGAAASLLYICEVTVLDFCEPILNPPRPKIDGANSPTPTISPTPSTKTSRGPPPNESESVEANFTYTPQTPSWRETVRFDASQSRAPGTTITEYLWQFRAPNPLPQSTGDVRRGIRVEYSFQTSGTHSVTLTIRTADGREAKASKNIEVQGPVVG